MAWFQREVQIEVPAESVWEAMRDVGHLHTRLVRGFVTACRFDGETRHLTFANGVHTAERIVAVDDAARRVSWAAISARLAHHNASAQVVPVGTEACRVVWTVDLLPDAMAPAIEAMVQAGLQAMKTTLQGAGTA